MLYAPSPLHLPDGFLSPLVAGIGWVLALFVLWQALRQTGRELGPRQVPLMGVLAAFIFAAQAINFPVVAGTSGHLVGAALAAILLGPWAASLVMSSVIVLQGLLFQDGGILVMGWNLINMGVLAAFVGRAGYDAVRRLVGEGLSGRLSGTFVGAWLSVMAGAIATAVELAASGTFPLALALPAMAGVHALIGAGEGMITLATVAFLASTRPALLEAGAAPAGWRAANLTLAGLVAALIIALFSPWASAWPDGLESVAEAAGFAGLALPAPFQVLPDYTTPVIPHPVTTTMVAVGLGTVLVFGAGLLLGKLAVAGES